MKNTKPNVMMITVDHWFASLFSGAGHPTVLTPTLDELARCGIRFTNAYSECPVCIPARRTLMTGLSPKGHNDRVFKDYQSLPDVPTLAQSFRNAGYQANAVGKLHVHPQRDRIGFDDVILDDEGRYQWGTTDDYDTFLGDQGYLGKQFDHGMSNNQYHYRSWGGPEDCHATNWATTQMARTIKRRDPTKPAFWYLGYRHPHPPLVPLQAYLDIYRDTPIDEPYVGNWSANKDELVYAAAAVASRTDHYTPAQIADARRAFYALCTHIDHQIRVIIGTLRQEGILDNTIFLFTSDHGDMLGNHNMLAKRVMYENSANIPMILTGIKDDKNIPTNITDNRLVGLQDVMPTLLDMCGIEIPKHVEGISMVRNQKRDWLYGECSEGDHATRMIHDGKFKLIYYPLGNEFQLFDLENDPNELINLSDEPDHKIVLSKLKAILISELYGTDLEWIKNGALVGKPDKEFTSGPNRSLSSQRGHGWPVPPKVDIVQIEWHNETKIDAETI